MVPVALLDTHPLASIAIYLNNPVPQTPVFGTKTTCVPDIEAMPPEILTSQVMLKFTHNTVPLSTSVSFANTSTVTVTFLFVEVLSFTATGLSLTQIIVIFAVAIFEPDGHRVSVSSNVKLSAPQ